MEALLKLEHTDFELLVSCNSYERIFRKAASCMRVTPDSEALKSYYTWNDESAVLTYKGKQIEQGSYAPSAFFENTDYQYWIRFKTKVKNAYIDTHLRSVSEGFSFNEDELRCIVHKAGLSQRPETHRPRHRRRIPNAFYRFPPPYPSCFQRKTTGRHARHHLVECIQRYQRRVHPCSESGHRPPTP